MPDVQELLNDIYRRLRACTWPSKVALMNAFVEAGSEKLRSLDQAGSIERASLTPGFWRMQRVRGRLHRLRFQRPKAHGDRSRPLEQRGRAATKARKLIGAKPALPAAANGFLGQYAVLLMQAGVELTKRKSEFTDRRSKLAAARKQATVRLVDLAMRYHHQVRSLFQVKDCKAVLYGRADTFRLYSDDGTFSRKGAGVWIESISKAPRIEDRVMTLVFERASGKTRFRATLPLLADPEDQGLDLRPPKPELPKITERDQAALDSLRALLGPNRRDQSASDLLGFLVANRVVPEHLRSSGLLHFGSDDAMFWDRRKGRWCLERLPDCLVRVLSVDAASGEVVLQVGNPAEPDRLASAFSVPIAWLGRSCRGTFPEFKKAEPYFGALSRLVDDRGAVVGYVLAEAGQSEIVLGQSMKEVLTKAA